MAHAAEHESHRRPREEDDDAVTHPSQRPRHNTNVPQGATGFINYLPRPDQLPLPLIQGDSDTFTDIVSLIGRYEDVLKRRDSLAANLGAKLTGPRLLKGIDNFFEGSVTIISQPHYPVTVTWSDIVLFAKSNGDEFKLTSHSDGTRRCQFPCKGCQVEICEDDWRLISSGALDGLALEQSFEEDELAELAALDIIEQRASILYKKADEVAARARILHHALGQRKNEITRRRQSQNPPPQRHSARMSAFGGAYDLHADLLQQFVSATAASSQSRSTSGAGLPLTPVGQQSPSLPMPTNSNTDNTGPAASVSSPSDAFRSLITQRIDKLVKGDTIHPPCDRCRRLRLSCVKHLTACQGCTKKHAKCSWKAVPDEEAARLRQEMGVTATESEAETAAEPRLPSWSGGPQIFQFSGRGQPEDGPRPESRGEGTATPTPMFNRVQNVNNGFELAPIKSRTGLPSGPESDNASLPRLNEHTLGHIASLAAQSVHEGHGHHLDYQGGDASHPSSR
ncbi:hypothetical protein NLU13_0199 [Sarocladium strictum]|uniref:Zn(2)-C6 fungal-type domain-containing protein n=1 Tax=Sarocladium strictum TaxID=5046 RepID=A0AA39GNX4_SARSR|nr:hypothetical protein NLU13_0199 [Sarocladium strictum]